MINDKAALRKRFAARLLEKHPQITVGMANVLRLVWQAAQADVKASEKSDDTALIKRLDGLAEVLTETAIFSCYAHTVYEAHAEVDRQAAQIAMLSGVLDKVRECTPSGYVFEIVMEALNATAADVEAWEKQRRDALIDTLLKLLEVDYDLHHDNARDMYMAARENLIMARAKP